MHSSDCDSLLGHGTRVLLKTVRGVPDVGHIVGSTVAYTGPITTRLYAVQVGPVVDGLATDVRLVREHDVFASEAQANTCLSQRTNC